MLAGKAARAASAVERAHGGRIERLVFRAREGDREAFAELYNEYASPIGRYVAAMVRDADVAEDVAAQTFLLAWRDLPGLRKVDRFEAWLFRIAHNQAINAIRRRSHTPLDKTAEPEDEHPDSSPAALVEREGEAIRVRAAIMQLPEAQRLVLQLQFFNQMSSQEVAERLGKTEQAIWALKYRALRRLRELLDEVEEE